MQIIGRGFLARNLTDSLGARHPGVTALAAGVSSTSVTAADQLDREAELVYRTLAECRARRRTLLFFSTASFAMYGSRDVPAPESGPLCPPSVYGRHKLALESSITSAGVDFLILRLSHLVGPHQREHQLLPALAGQVQTGTVTVHRGAYRDLLDVADLVHAIDQLLTGRVRDQVINVASGTPEPVERVIEGIERRLGRTARRVYVPGAVARTLVSTDRLRCLGADLPAVDAGAGYLDRLLDQYLVSTAPISTAPVIAAG